MLVVRAPAGTCHRSINRSINGTPASLPASSALSPDAPVPPIELIQNIQSAQGIQGVRGLPVVSVVQVVAVGGGGPGLFIDEFVDGVGDEVPVQRGQGGEPVEVRVDVEFAGVSVWMNPVSFMGGLG